MYLGTGTVKLSWLHAQNRPAVISVMPRIKIVHKTSYKKKLFVLTYRKIK
jgi:hypothetical protein